MYLCYLNMNIMTLLKNIPNLITLLNLFSGILSIYFASKGDLSLAGWLVFLAAIFDFMDGMSARLLKAWSEIGKQLDSLADVVSFGVAPAFIVHHLILSSHGRQSWDFSGLDILPFIPFLLPLFSAFRLAKFNVDERQTDSFIGLPTPATGILLASLPLVKEQLYAGQSLFYMVVTNTYFYIGLVLLLSLLMVSELSLFGLKFKSFKLKGNEIRYFFLLASVILLLIFQVVAIPFIIALYLLVSLFVFLVDLS